MFSLFTFNWAHMIILNLGIGDLKSGKVVTPLPAKLTFLDDPLRVLRAIRFGESSFTIDNHFSLLSFAFFSP